MIKLQTCENLILTRVDNFKNGNLKAQSSVNQTSCILNVEQLERL